MTSYKTLISQSFPLAARLFRAQIGLLAPLFLLTCFFSLQLEDAAKAYQPGQDTEWLALQFTNGFLNFASDMFLIFALSWGVAKVAPLTGAPFLAQPFKRVYIGSFFAEYFRLLGKTLLWGLLLIVPGFVRYVQFSFVPLITLFSAQYERNEVDALALSTKMANRCIFFLIGFFIFSMVIDAGLYLAPNRWIALHTLPFRALFYFAGFLLSIWSYSLMILLFEREMKR